MTTWSIVRGALIAGAIVSVAAPVSTQPEQDRARPQVETFEMVLGRAIETAGRNFASRAVEMAPEIVPVAAFGEMPHVAGVAVREMGLYVFHVQVPGMNLRLQMLNLMVNRPLDGRRGLEQPVGRVESTGVVEPDPMGPATGGEPTQRDFLAEYRNQVREALIDAIVDNSGTLPMRGDDTLLVFTGGVDSPLPNPLYRPPTHRLVLRARAADLEAFRENRISRDEARRRVTATE